MEESGSYGNSGGHFVILLALAEASLMGFCYAVDSGNTPLIIIGIIVMVVVAALFRKLMQHAKRHPA